MVMAQIAIPPKVSNLDQFGGLKQAYLFNPRNAYQNYNVAVNLSSKTLIPIWGLAPQIRQCQLFFRRTTSPHLMTLFISVR